MPFATQAFASQQLVLEAETAADLMTRNPAWIRQDATLLEAADLLLKQDVGALPVLDASHHPVGVLSRTDIVRHFRDSVGNGSITKDTGLHDVMTHAFLAVPSTTTAIEVVAQFLGLGNVHQFFVLDDDRALIGVISARDVLRKLRRLEVS